MSAQMIPALALLLLAAAPQDRAARVERLYAALPQPTEAPRIHDAIASREAALALRAPTKKESIAAAMRELATCRADAERQLTASIMREALGKLSDSELDQLTVFYAGSDYRAMVAAGDKVDMKPLMARYPLQRFNDVIVSAFRNDMPPKLFAALAACDAAADKRLIAAGVQP